MVVLAERLLPSPGSAHWPPSIDASYLWERGLAAAAALRNSLDDDIVRAVAACVVDALRRRPPHRRRRWRDRRAHGGLRGALRKERGLELRKLRLRGCRVLRARELLQLFHCGRIHGCRLPRARPAHTRRTRKKRRVRDWRGCSRGGPQGAGIKIRRCAHRSGKPKKIVKGDAGAGQNGK